MPRHAVRHVHTQQRDSAASAPPGRSVCALAQARPPHLQRSERTSPPIQPLRVPTRRTFPVRALDRRSDGAERLITKNVRVSRVSPFFDDDDLGRISVLVAADSERGAD
jgi:hypothetical protein